MSKTIAAIAAMLHGYTRAARGAGVGRPTIALQALLDEQETQMAHIRREITIEASPEAVWGAVRDWGALHERLVPGFVVDTQLDGDDRIVTFFNGTVLRELLVDLDDDARRLAWSVVDGPYTHHNASAQVFAEGEHAARFVWTADLLPDELAAPTGEMMQKGTNVVKQTLEAQAVRS
jgi:carbon monoxide dehydrogenase subunit G